MLRIIKGSLFLGLAFGLADAATTPYSNTGSMAKAINTCFNIAVALGQNDCSYAKTRYPAKVAWQGPIGATGFYAKGSPADITDPDQVLNGFVPGPGDGKINVQMSGTVTIDDNDTPTDGTDDTISAVWNFGAAAHNATTGNGDRAVERWDSWNHTMAATPVNAATAQPGGGFKYLIGSRGEPQPLCLAADATDCFPSENIAGGIGVPSTDPSPWNTTVANSSPVSARIGIERSLGWGAFISPTGNPLTPNIGATTIGSLANWSCTDNPGDTDCTISASLIGPVNGVGPNGAPHGINPPDVPLGPGFSNVVLILTTDGVGAVTSATAYWTREYIIASGPEIGTDPLGSGQYTINNSWDGGVFTFTGSMPDADGDGVPNASDNCAQVATPTQCDSDADGFGNRCDGDLTNNGFTNTQDYAAFRNHLGHGGTSPFDVADINCNGTVNNQDYGLFRGLLGAGPGPSGLSCAGTVPCL